MNLISAAEMVLDWWHEWRDEPPEPEEAVAFEALQAALNGEAARVKQLEEALRPFATVALELPDIVLNDDLVVIETFRIQVPASAFYTARALLLNGGSNERA